MTEYDNTINESQVDSELPDGWEADADGDTVVHIHPSDGSEPAEAPASFTIKAMGHGLWEATMYTPNPLRAGLHDPYDDVTGAKERVVGWVADKADSVKL